MSSNKRDKVCSVHHNTMFCRNDNASDQHKEHAHLEKELEERRQKIKMRVEQKEKELEELKRTAAQLSSSAEAALTLSKNTFTKMIELMKEKDQSMEQQVRSLQHGVQTGYRVHLDNITEDIEDMKKEIAHRESLIKTSDAYEFLLKNNALLEMSELPEERYTCHHWLPFKKFTHDKNQTPMCVTTLSVFNEQMASEHIFKEVRKTRLESAHICLITWDPNTAHRNVSLKPNSEGNECATYKSQPKDYPDHPDRFTDCVQVLGREPLTGRCYFEVRPTGACFIGLAYKSIERKGRGKRSVLGLNDKSWACFGGGYVPQSTENGTWLLIPNPCTNRVGVYLDYERGILTFYAVFTETLVILYTVETKFTEPLYFGAVFMYPGDYVVILDVEDLS